MRGGTEYDIISFEQVLFIVEGNGGKHFLVSELLPSSLRDATSLMEGG